MSTDSAESWKQPSGLHLQLPATSANLGPGFDALGLAMSFYLTIDATAASDGKFAITATGRDANLCGSLERNLILDTYRDVIRRAGGDPAPLHLALHNEIPLGMGCGSSAAALLAGVLLANHFDQIGMTGYEAMEEACRREGHPDNVAACYLGGMTVSGIQEQGDEYRVLSASFPGDPDWRLLLVKPDEGLPTSKARALLPDTYTKTDAVTNVQHTALLVAAFASQRSDLLKTAMEDQLHQPYRAAACPLLPLLLPLREMPGVYGVALSGAGPAVLLICECGMLPAIRSVVLERAGQVELIEAGTAKGTVVSVTQVTCT